MRELEPFVTVDLGRVPVDRTPVEAGPDAGGSAVEAGFAAVGSLWDAEIGVWEMTEGRMDDVEVDEAFIVLSGHATVTLFADDGERTIELAPGALCRLSAGMRTRWHVTSTLRKVYLLPPPTSAPTKGADPS